MTHGSFKCYVASDAQASSGIIFGAFIFIDIPSHILVDIFFENHLFIIIIEQILVLARKVRVIIIFLFLDRAWLWQRSTQKAATLSLETFRRAERFLHSTTQPTKTKKHTDKDTNARKMENICGRGSNWKDRGKQKRG